jgi:hypothetical protein
LHIAQVMEMMRLINGKWSDGACRRHRGRIERITLQYDGWS